jgi:hypothetical protein
LNSNLRHLENLNREIHIRQFLLRWRHAEKITLGFEAKARGGPLQFGAIFIFSIRLHLFGVE